MHHFILDEKHGRLEKNVFFPSKSFLHQLTKVLRLTKKENFICYYNSKKYLCFLENNQIKILEEQELKVKNQKKLILILAIPKIKTLEFVLEKATELGVDEIILWRSEFSPTSFDQKLYDKKKERFYKIISEACEQSRRDDVPKLSYVKIISDFQKLPQISSIVLWEKEKLSNNLKKFDEKVLKTNDVYVFFGPEGGFSLNEINYLVKTCKFTPISLGENILRVETAILNVISLINYIRLINE